MHAFDDVVKGWSLGAKRGNSVGVGLLGTTGGILGIVGGGLIAVTYSSVLVKSSCRVCHMSSHWAISSCSCEAFNCHLMQVMVLLIAASIQSHLGCSIPKARHTSCTWLLQ